MSPEIPPAQPLDLVPLLGLAPGSRIGVVGDPPARLRADLAAAGHEVVEEAATAGLVILARTGRLRRELLQQAAEGLPREGMLVLIGRRGAVRGAVRDLRRAGLTEVLLLGLDDADAPAVAVTLRGASAPSMLVRRLRQPWTRADVARRARDVVLAASPARGRLLPSALAVVRRG